MMTDHFSPGAALHYAAVATGVVLLLIACWNDILFRILPNWISAACAAVGIALRLEDGTILASLLAALVIFAGALFCWKRGWLGGGDVKLLSVCALLVTGPQIMMLVLLTTVFGGVLAVIYVALKPVAAAGRRRSAAPAGRAPTLLRRVLRVERRRISLRGPLPYGCAISAAAVMLLLASPYVSGG